MGDAGRGVGEPPRPALDERPDRVGCFEAVSGQQHNNVAVGDGDAAIDGRDECGCADGGGRFDVDALSEEVAEGCGDLVVVDGFGPAAGVAQG